METIQYGDATIQVDRLTHKGGEIAISARLCRMKQYEAIVAFGSEMQSREPRRLVCRDGTFDAMPTSWAMGDDPRTGMVGIEARLSVRKVNDAHPYRSSAPREEEPPRRANKVLKALAREHSLDRKPGESDEALYERFKRQMMPVPTWLGVPAPPFLSEQVKRMQEADELRARATMYGVELDPGETIEGLRERVDAYLAGDERAKDPRAWQEERTRRAGVRNAATGIGVAMNSAPKDGIVEVRVDRPVYIGAPAVRPLPEDTRAENRRAGEEIAGNPPEWAYPLAWRLAVMAMVEAYNNTKTIVPFDTRYWEQKVAPSLRAYHHARLDGLLPDPAMMKAVRDGKEPLDKDVVEKLYDGIACQAYERGRPGLGGVRVGRPS